MTAILIFTDLDGTLLDHHDYSYAAAEEAMNVLASRRIPLILNTSKTASEVLALRGELGNQQPFIVENGAGIYLPKNCDFDCSGASEVDGFWRLDIGRPRQSVLAMLHRLRGQRGFRFTGFADMSVAELVDATGLTEGAAQQAMQRDYTEPLLWQDSEQARLDFADAIAGLGLQLLVGGRFLHVAAPADKGRAMRELTRRYQGGGRQGGGQGGEQTVIIALGDGGNDIAMLEAADWPVVIPAVDKPSLKLVHPKARTAPFEGPVGWNEAVLGLLHQLDKR